MWVGLTFLTLLTLHSTNTERTTERMREVPAEFRPVLYSCHSANWNSAGTPVLFAVLCSCTVESEEREECESHSHSLCSSSHSLRTSSHSSCSSSCYLCSSSCSSCSSSPSSCDSRNCTAVTQLSPPCPLYGCTAERPLVTPTPFRALGAFLGGPIVAIGMLLYLLMAISCSHF